MKLTGYTALTSMADADLLVAIPAASVAMRRCTAATLATYILGTVNPAYLLTGGTNRLLMETGIELELDGAITNSTIQDLAAVTVPAIGDLLVAVDVLSGQTKSIRAADLAAYLTVRPTVAATPTFLTEAGDTLVSEASEAIEVE